MCDINCLECVDQFICISCNSSYLFNQSCITQCPHGYFGDASLKTFVGSISCILCNNPCNTCSISGSNCSSCKFGLFLLLVNGLGTCVSSCPVNLYYIDQTNQNCVPCSDINCLQCSLIV